MVYDCNFSPNNEKLSVLMKIRTNQKALLVFFVLGMIAKVTQALNFSIILETSNVVKRQFSIIDMFTKLHLISHAPYSKFHMTM